MRIDLLMQDRPAEAASPLPPGDGRRMEVNEPDATATGFDILLQSLYDAAVLTDFNGGVVNANERALSFFDYRRSTFIGLAVEKLIPGAGGDIIATVIENVQSERFTLLQAYCARSDGSVFPAEISVTCLRLAPHPLLCFFIRDITVRREMEEKLRIEHNAIQNAGAGIAITDPGGFIGYVNPALCAIWNSSGTETILNRCIQEFFAAPGIIDDAISAAIAVRTWHGELQALRPDGGLFYVHTSITSCFDDDNHLTHLVFSFADTTRRRQDEEALRRYRDHLEDLILDRTADLETSNRDLKNEIAERERVEKELRDAIGKLREHDESKSQFVSNVSHELRTPLTSLIHAAENLIRGVAGPVNPPVYSYLTMMLEDCWRLDRTICDILDLGRIESGRLVLNTACIPFRRLTERMVEAVRMEAENVPLTLRMEPGAASGFVECDAVKMEHVITNVLGNAIKFTPPGGSVSVKVMAQNRGGADGICCRVTDSGIGIPLQFIPRVTERFFRVGEQVGGTGLGLAIVKEITERHQGLLDIASPPPGASNGTQVSIWLPAATSRRIMIATHDPGFCAEIECALNQRDYQTVCCHLGAQALQTLHDGKQHLVIVDALIPDMDGIEVVMHIKADALLRALPVLFLSEETPAPAKFSILRGFGIPVLSKSIGITMLANAVEDAFLPQGNIFTHQKA